MFRVLPVLTLLSFCAAAPAFPQSLIPVPEGTLQLADAVTGFTLPVRIGAFQMGRTEVTQDEYTKVMGKNPAHFKEGQRPVENVSWWDALAYCNRRSELEKLQPCYDLRSGSRSTACNGYRLPTSAEWTLAAGPSSAKQDPDRSRLRSGRHNDIEALRTVAAAGTFPAGSAPASALGLHDLYGNVWEWVEDWFNVEKIVDSVRDPRGPARGVERTIRGGSILTNAGQWTKGFVSSQPPSRRSPFTGFRVVRSTGSPLKAPGPEASWLAQFQNKPGAAGAGASKPQPADSIRERWLKVLGEIPAPARPVKAEVVEELREHAWRGQLLALKAEEDLATRVLVVQPAHPPEGKLPVVIVPFYDVDTPAGKNLGGRNFTAGGSRSFAYQAAQRGFIAVAVRWFAEGDGESYDEAIWKLAQRHPGVTGMGKWIWDARRVVDYLATRPDVDMSRIGIMGHSLGGKMALYAAAFEPRISVVVSSEPGISLSFSNYEDFWYFGKRIELLPKGADQHELLGLIAPRPFLLIGGESSDGDKSWPVLEAAREYYKLKGVPLHIGMINHRSGHSPSEKSVLLSMEWFERFFSVSSRE